MPTINGTSAADVLEGNYLPDDIHGAAGDDALSGGDKLTLDTTGPVPALVFFAYDSLYGDAGNDILYGDNNVLGFQDSLSGAYVPVGNLLDGGPGDDTMYGGGGDETYYVDSSNDQIVEPNYSYVIRHTGEFPTGTGGHDSVNSSVSYTLPTNVEDLIMSGSSNLDGVGNDSNNAITGNGGANGIAGLVGDDVLSGSGGDDRLYGGDGNDWINGENGNDPLALGQTAGNDSIDSGSGDDTVLGGDGDDQIAGGDGIDVLVGEGGNDVIFGQAGIDYVDGRQGNDQLLGGDGNDILFGDGLTTVFGFGSDTIHGDNGDDMLMGESGDHNAPGGSDGMYGDDGNDVIYGGAGDDSIFGGNGNDIIDGGAGNDSITGGPGADIMVGSADSTNVGGPAATTGNDVFIYAAMADGGDTIYGFDTRAGNMDGIDLRPLFDALGYTGTTARADGWLTVTTGNTPADAVIWVDANGGGNSFVPLLTVAGVAPAALTDAFFLIQ